MKFYHIHLINDALKLGVSPYELQDLGQFGMEDSGDHDGIIRRIVVGCVEGEELRQAGVAGDGNKEGGLVEGGDSGQAVINELAHLAGGVGEAVGDVDPAWLRPSLSLDALHDLTPGGDSCVHGVLNVVESLLLHGGEHVQEELVLKAPGQPESGLIYKPLTIVLLHGDGAVGNLALLYLGSHSIGADGKSRG